MRKIPTGQEDRLDEFSPTDFRYAVGDLKPYLTEEAFIRYKVRVESALVKVLAKYKICTKDVSREIIKAANSVIARDVYEEEKRIHHDIRALVNVIRNKVSNKAKPFVHLAATSYDIVDTANSLRFKEATENVLIPDMLKLERVWISLAVREKNTLQIGRTHGQHAEPITFGFAVSLYVHRWGERIIRLRDTLDNLTGKFSGAVGAYNASSLFFNDPEKLEKDVLSELGMKPAEISTQIIPPEPLSDFIHTIVSSFSVLANFSDDMRHLQRSEIAEVGEAFGEEQVGSSTMPQKRNPINFENVKSMWKAFMPRMLTVYMDGISEHQRDLTNSCSQRYLPELLVAFDSSVRRMINVSSRLKVDKKNMLKNFKLNEDKIVAEPLYIILAALGHTDAHEYVRQKTRDSIASGKSLTEIVLNDPALKSYLSKLKPLQKDIISNPAGYTGIAVKKTEKITSFWKKRLII